MNLIIPPLCEICSLRKREKISRFISDGKLSIDILVSGNVLNI